MPLMWPWFWVYMMSKAESSQPSGLRWEGTTPEMQVLLFTADSENPGSSENCADPECVCFVLALYCCCPLCTF